MSFVNGAEGFVSILNSTTVTLAGDAVFTGTGEDVSQYTEITVFTYAEESSTTNGLSMEFSTNGTNWDHKIQFTHAGATQAEVHTLTCISQFFRLVYTNGNDAQSVFRIQTIFHTTKNLPPIGKIGTDFTSGDDVIPTRTVLNAHLPNNKYKNIEADNDGHLEVSVHGPITAFGEISTENNTPVIQTDFVYGVNEDEVILTTQGDGGVSGVDGMAVVSTQGPNSRGSFISTRIMKYRPGQGALGRFTTVFSSGQFGTTQEAGFGAVDAGLFFSYQDETFGTLRVQSNITQIMNYEVTTGSSDIQNATVTLDGTASTGPLTVSALTTGTVYELATFDYNTIFPGWKATTSGSNVCFQKTAGGEATGVFSISYPSSGAGTFVTGIIGADAVNDFIPQTSWNVDTMDGTGSTLNPSNVLLDPLKGNVYTLKYQYLGFGLIEYGIEEPIGGEFVPVHRTKYANANIIPSLATPSFPFSFTCRSTSGIVPITMKCGSFAGFNQGSIVNLGPQRSFSKFDTSITTTDTPFFSIRNDLLFNEKTNQTEIRNELITIANEGGKGAIVSLRENALLNNTAFFFPVAIGRSPIWIDTEATSYTGGNVLGEYSLTGGTDVVIDLNRLNSIVSPNSSLTITARSVQTTTDLSVSMQWVENH